MTEPTTADRPRRRFALPLSGRDPGEAHRASTPLELFFDLCFVVAIAQAAGALHHAVGTHHVGHGLVGFTTCFFAIWWAWMNFTWFASAYDTDDVAYRLLVLVQIAGALIVAASVPRAFDDDFTALVVGYVVMRLALVPLWLRAARDDPEHAAVARAYAAGIVAVQVLWIARLALPDGLGLASFAVLAVVELSIPMVAERRGPMTTWHAEHINERYGLFTIIVLGECVAAATVAVQGAIDESGLSASLLLAAVGGLLVMFSIWWSYFERPAAEVLDGHTARTSFLWGYGHVFVFAAIAALGAGLQVVAEAIHHADEVAPTTAAWAVAIPLALYVATIGLIHGVVNRDHALEPRAAAVAIALVLLLAAMVAGPVSLPVAILAMGVVAGGLVAADLARGSVRPRSSSRPG